MMNIRYISLVTILIVVLFTSASAQWYVSGPTQFMQVHAFGGGRFFVTGGNGVIYQTDDFGDTWHETRFHPGVNLYAIAFRDSNHGMVSEGNGSIELTSDGGQSWEEHSTNLYYAISSMTYASSDTVFGCAAYGSLYRSINGGKDWDSFPFPSKEHLQAIHFFNTKHGIVCGYSGLFMETIDGGINWYQRATPLSSDFVCMDVSRAGRIVISTGNREILTSVDTGKTWEYSVLPISSNTAVYSVKMTSADTIVAFSSYMTPATNSRFLSTDFGKTWRIISVNPGAPYKPTYELTSWFSFLGADFDDSGNGLAVGDYGTIYRLTNYGFYGGFIRHCAFGLGGPIDDNAGAMFDLPNPASHTIHIVGAEKGPWAYSTDMGETWMTGLDPNHRGAQYVGIHFTDDTTGNLFTTWGVSPNRHTRDNGDSWGSIANPPGHASLSTRDRAGVVYIVSDSGIYRSTSGGLSWSKHSEYNESVPRTSDRKVQYSTIGQLQIFDDVTAFGLVWTWDSLFVPVEYAHPETGFSTAELIVRGEGNSWMKRYEFPLGSLCNGICFVNSLLGYALIRNTTPDSLSMGWCLRTTDGGYHWNKMDGLLATTEFKEMKFSNNGRYGLLLSRNGEIHYSLDSGMTWKHDTLASVYDRYPQYTKRLYDAYFADDTTVFITSDFGFWKQKINIEKLSVPERSVASLNPYTWIYPYPTPVTGNNFHIYITGLASFNDRSVTTLKLYDILGREVADLSANFRSQPIANTADLDIDANHLLPGVYIVVLSRPSTGGVSARVVIAR